MTNQQRSFRSPDRWGLDFISPKSLGLMSSLALLWLLLVNPGHSLAQTPTIPAWMNPLQNAGALHPQDYPDLCVQMNKIPEFDGGVINLSTCDSSNSQIWVLYADNTLHPAAYPTLCMTLDEMNVANSEQLYVALCDGSNSQKWNGNANHNLYLQGYPDYCVGLYSSQSSVGDPIYLLPCDGSSSQMWNVTAAQIIPTPTNTPTPTLTPTQTNTPTPTVWIDPLAQGGTLNPQDYPGFCLNLQNNQGSNGALINLGTCNGSNGQQWVLYADQTIRPIDYPTFCLTADYTPEQPPRIYLWTCNSSTGNTIQWWKSYANHNLSSLNSPYCLNLPNNAASDGALINMALCDGSNGQNWNVPVSGVAHTPTPTQTPIPPTATPTSTPTNTSTNTPLPTATSTDTSVPPTATPTDTQVPPTATPTDTSVPLTATPTYTQVPPTATPTDTPVPPTATPTPTAVVYTWAGFLQPVDNLPVINTVNAGQSIPVKFSLGGNYGLNIFASGYPASQTVSCGSSGSSTSPIDQTVTAGNSTLQYDATTQTYTYVWKTDKTWAGTCRALIVKLVDGTTHTAFFRFNGKVSGAAADGAAAVTQQVFLPVVSR